VITTEDSDVRDHGLVNSLRCRASARSLSGDGGTREGSSRSLDRSRLSRRGVDGLAAGCNGLVGCSEVSNGEPGAEEGGLAVGTDRSRARHERSDGRCHLDRDGVGLSNRASICRNACRLDDSRRGGGGRVDRASSNRASADSTSGSVEVRRINGERYSVRGGSGERVVSKAGCVLRGASSHVGLVLGTASIVGGFAVSGRTLLELELARKCRSSSQECNSGEGGSEVHVD